MHTDKKRPGSTDPITLHGTSPKVFRIDQDAQKKKRTGKKKKEKEKKEKKSRFNRPIPHFCMAIQSILTPARPLTLAIPQSHSSPSSRKPLPHTGPSKMVRGGLRRQ